MNRAKYSVPRERVEWRSAPKWDRNVVVRSDVVMAYVQFVDSAKTRNAHKPRAAFEGVIRRMVTGPLIAPGARSPMLTWARNEPPP